MAYFENDVGMVNHQEWWLQNDHVKEGWGPFESEAAAWRHLFGREQIAADLLQHEDAGWYVGYINKWAGPTDKEK